MHSNQVASAPCDMLSVPVSGGGGVWRFRHSLAARRWPVRVRVAGAQISWDTCGVSSTSYLARRIFKALFTIFFVTTLTFFLVRLLPGNPVEVYIAKQMAEYGMSYHDAADGRHGRSSRSTRRAALPAILQLPGRSRPWRSRQVARSPSGAPVTAIILQYLPWTLFSVGLGLLLAFTLGIALGMLDGLPARDGRSTIPSRLLASLFHSIPNYLLAIMIVVFFGVRLGWLPIAKMRGSYSSGQSTRT